jgi:hypothetical protein
MPPQEYSIFGNPERKIPLERLVCRWENNIKMDCKEICEKLWIDQMSV